MNRKLCIEAPKVDTINLIKVTTDDFEKLSDEVVDEIFRFLRRRSLKVHLVFSKDDLRSGKSINDPDLNSFRCPYYVIINADFVTVTVENDCRDIVLKDRFGPKEYNNFRWLEISR